MSYHSQKLIVMVSTDSETATEGFEDGAGSECFGPFEQAEAYAFAERIEIAAAKHNPKEFLYGQVNVEVIALNSYNINDAELAIANWVDEDWKRTVREYKKEYGL